jgi:hypothetical protein
MEPTVKLLSGLPPYGPMWTAFPPEWGSIGREGTVVEFGTEAGAWVANFRSGLGGLRFASLLPDKRNAIVIAGGDLWIIELATRTAVRELPAIEAMWEVQGPEGWVFSRQGIAFARLGAQGLMWHTRRLSWDGFDQVKIDRGELRGLAWSPVGDGWCPFSVELETGRSEGGSYLHDDTEGWEILAG